MRPSLPHFRSMPNSSEVVRAMSNPHASSEGRTLSGWRPGFSRGACAAPLGAMEARSDVGERSAAVEPFHFEQARFEPQPLGADQPSGLRDGNAARFGDDLCCDEQRRGVACEVFVHVESERRASPAPPVIGTGAAVAADPSGVTEPGDVFGCGELGGEVPGGVSERRIHAAKIVVFFGLALRPAASGHEICGTGGKSSYGRQRFYASSESPGSANRVFRRRVRACGGIGA